MSYNRYQMIDSVTASAVIARSAEAVSKHGFASTPLNPSLDRFRKLAILTEEVGEVAKELCETPGPDGTTEQWEAWKLRLQKELGQVAAVAAMWLESEER